MNRLMTFLLIVILTSGAIVGCTSDSGNANEPRPSLAAAQAAQPTSEPNESDDIAQASVLEGQWGIKVERAALSAGGYMVDFRYRVLNREKAAPILDRSVRPYLIDQATGAKFIVPTPPKVGQLRSGGNIREGAIYYILFANPGRYIRSGNKVTVVVGDFEAKDVVVQ